jgi:phosphonate transport system substrate-binding protein
MKIIFVIKPIKIFFNICIVLLSIILASNKLAYAEESLILAVHPYLPSDVLTKKFTPIAKYLSSQIGIPIKVRIGSNYDEHIEYIGLNKVDIAYMGPASYVRMSDKFANKPILSRLEINGNPWFQGNIIARKDSGITSIDGLKGKRIAYGDPNSTMSYIVPHYMLYKAGFFSDPLSKYQFLHSHSNVAFGVLSGDFDAGAVKPAVFKKFESEGLYTITKTPKIAEHLFVARNDLADWKIKKLQKAMLNMKNSNEGMTALKAIKKSITGLVKASKSDYENLREIILEVDKLQ